MGTVYTLPVLNYPNLVPDGTVVVSSTAENNCRYVLANGLLIAGNGTSNGILCGSNVDGTLSAWYHNSDGDSGRYYFVAINRTSNWIRSSGSISDISSASYRTASWGYNNLANTFIYGSNASLGYSAILDFYPNKAEAERALGINIPITYRPTNCSFPGAPTEAAVGDTVVVPVAFPDGYGLVNESNIYVTNNGVVIPSTYSNGQLTFTMPNPS